MLSTAAHEGHVCNYILFRVTIVASCTIISLRGDMISTAQPQHLLSHFKFVERLPFSMLALIHIVMTCIK